MKKGIRLFWWSEVKLMGKPKENYGDLLGKYLVERISNKKAVWVHPKKNHFKDLFKPIYVTTGSILSHVNKKCVVWGSGIISKDIFVKKAKFLAIRGPVTRSFLIDLGYDVPEIYGDPALLLPKYYSPKTNKKYALGIVPHYSDYKLVKELYGSQDDILIIDLMTNDVEQVTDLFLQCEKIMSSSLHGLIVSHAYGIPAVWVKFSNNLFGDGVKFQDYFESVDIPNYIPSISENTMAKHDIEKLFDSYPVLPKAEKIQNLQEGLLSASPF